MHLRLWRFAVPAEAEERFLAAYGPRGSWASLFAQAPGFIRTELWREADGSYLTADYWQCLEDFDRFQQCQGDAYSRLDKELESIAGIETFVGAFELAG